jgi:hypothetical protein
MDRMFCYLWWEKSHPNECKFGERWVFDGQDPEKEIYKRIKDSLGVRKDLLKSGEVELFDYWNVTEYAKKINRYYKQSRVDDAIRPYIGHRKDGSREVHSLSPQEVKNKVDKFLAEQGQPLPLLSLAVWQARGLEKFVESVKQGSRTIGGELCGRFGKTTFAGAAIRELNAPLTVIASYVLTSFTSFENDLSGFEQFKDLVLVDTKDDDYQETIDLNLAQGKQVVAFVSLCASGSRQTRIDFLSSRLVQRLWFIDEADYGAQRPSQANMLKQARHSDDIVFPMTGTDADQATALWELDAPLLTTTYPELVMEKHNPCNEYSTTLKYFTIDPTRSNKVVDIEFYQAGIKELVDQYLRENPDIDSDLLGSWSKSADNVVKAKGWWARWLEASFLGKSDFPEMNIDYQTKRKSKDGIKVAMAFLPGSMPRNKDNDQLAELVDVANQCLQGWIIVPVYGQVTTNKQAEALVKEKIEIATKQGKNVLILSAGMAQRSFGVGKITEVHLCYDGSDASGTSQKIWRGVTPEDIGKIARIISWSLDPNRDNKFDTAIIDTITNFKQSRGIASAKDALREVLKTLDIFRCTEDGRLKIQPDNYLKQLQDRNSISRVGGMQAPVSSLTDKELEALKDGNADAWHAAKQEVTITGKKHKNTAKQNNKVALTKSSRTKLLEHARQVIATIIENIDIIVYGTNSTQLNEALEKLKHDKHAQESVESVFNIPFALLKDLFDRKIIKQDYVELLVDQ